MGFISNLYQKAQKDNILAGIIISDIIAFIAYAIISSGIVFFGDFQMVLGVIIGTYFALKHLKEDQAPLKTGVVVALGGSLLAAFSMYFYDWTMYLTAGVPFPILFIVSYILEALIIGLVIGAIEGFYFKKKSRKTKVRDDLDNEFFESLKIK